MADKFTLDIATANCKCFSYAHGAVRLMLSSLITLSALEKVKLDINAQLDHDIKFLKDRI